MRHWLMTLLLAMFLPLSLVAGAPMDNDTISVRRAFVEMPPDVLDLLNTSTRLDMLDYFDADSIWSAPNTMEGRSELKSVTPDFIAVQLTAVSVLQIKTLPLKKGGDVVATSYTIDSEGNSADSRLRFFGADMSLLPLNKFFKEPKLKDFFNIPRGSLTTMKEIEQIVTFPTIRYDLSADSSTLKATLTVGEYVDADNRKIIELFMVPTIEYQWDGKMFRLKK